MGRILRADFGRREQERMPVEEWIALMMGSFRQRSGLSKLGFARAVDAGCRRHHGLMDASIEGFESGDVPPGADIFFVALEVSSAPKSIWCPGPARRGAS